MNDQHLVDTGGQFMIVVDDNNLYVMHIREVVDQLLNARRKGRCHSGTRPVVGGGVAGVRGGGGAGRGGS